MKTEYSKRYLRAVTVALALGALCLVALPASAARTATWTGGSGISSYWSYSFNWDISGGGSALPQDGDDLVFPSTAARPTNTNNLTDRHFRSITFEAGSMYSIHGNPITLTNGITSGGQTVLGFEITLAAPQTFEATASGLLTLSSNVAFGTHTLTLDCGGVVRLSGVLSGTGGLTKNGAGSLLLEGDGYNSYTGYTRVNAGTLYLAKNDTPAIPSGSELVIGDGIGGAGADKVIEEQNYQIGNGPITIYCSGLLDLEGHNDTVGAIEFRDGGLVSTVGPSSTGTLTLGGTVTAVFPNPLDSDTFAPRIEGQLQLSAFITSRTFDIANGADSPDLELRAVLKGDSNLVKTGVGALGLYADNTGYGGTVTVNEGLVYLYHNAALGDTSDGTVVNDGGVLVLPGGRSIGAEPLTLNGQGDGRSGALASSSGVNSWAGSITLASDADITVRAGSTLSLSGVIGGPGGFTKAQRDETLAQTGILILTGAAGNTFAGDAYVDAGILEMDKVGAQKSVPTTLHVGTDSGASHSVVARNTQDLEVWGGNVVVNRSGLYDLNGYNETINRLTLNLGGDVQTGAGTLTLMSSSTVTVTASPALVTVATISGKFHLGSGSRGFDVGFGYRLPGGPSQLVVDAVVSGSATIVKTGAGEMELAAANNFTGGVTVDDGNLLVTHASALGTTAGGTTVGNGAQLLLSGSLAVGNEALTLNSSATSALYASGGDSSWAGGITLSEDASVSVATGWKLDLRGAISGAGGLTKEGDGRLLFTGAAANTYAGATRVNAGTLELAKTVYNGAVPGDLFIGDGIGAAEADVVFVADESQIGDNASVTITNSGKLEMSGIVGLVEDIGLLKGSGNVQLGSMELQVGNNLSSTYAGTIVGLGKLTKEGAATLTLTGPNTYSGQTTVKEGTLVVNGSQPASKVVVQSGATLGGSGTVGLIEQAGAVAPGASLTDHLSTLTSKGLLLAASTAHLDFELNGPTPGTGQDMLYVQGTVTLNGLGQPRIAVGCAPREGDQFTIIANDGADAVVGTFAGLAEGAVFAASSPNPLKFRISYHDGSGNDVVLTVTDTALTKQSVAVLWGNGNGVLDPNECDTLNVVLHNRDATTVTGIQAELSTTTPGVWISQPGSPYPNIPSGSSATNTRPFQVSMLPEFVCGSPIHLALKVQTAIHGTFTITFDLPSGCDDGGGPCLPCPDLEIHGSIAGTDPEAWSVLLADGTPSTCAAPKSCPGAVILNPFPAHYDAYTFQNGASNACVTVELTPLDARGQLFCAAYDYPFAPGIACLRYLADAGVYGSSTYSFKVAPGAAFVAVVVDRNVATLGAAYTLRVSGGSCVPWLNLSRTTGDKVALSWPTFASDFHLHATNQVEQVTNCVPVLAQPLAIGGACVLTNRAAQPKCFYILHRP